MSMKLTQPKVDNYLEWLSRNDHFGMCSCAYDAKSNALLDEMFEILEQVSPIRKNGERKLWLRADRGEISDFGDMEEAIADGEYASEAEFIQTWKDWYPNEVEWYELSTVQDKEGEYRMVVLRHACVIAQAGRKELSRFVNEIPEFVQWLLDGVKECVEMLRAGTYNEFVRDNLPPQHKTGTIRRKDYWDVWPEAREAFFEDITPDDVAEFIQKASAQVESYDLMEGRLPSMTANDFFRFCAMGYAENRYEGCEKTPKEQYYLHADGRDDGLGDVSPDDPEAFRAWLDDRTHRSGHPWEVCRGGNSTHVSLYPWNDDKGYFLLLEGAARNRTIETVKFFLALTRAGIPVYLQEAQMLADRLAEREKIGIVPQGVIPKYCEHRFPKEHIIDYINLPREDREKFLPFCTWYEEPRITLITEKEGNPK